MDYCVASSKVTREDKVAELRANLIMVHNKYSENKISNTKQYFLDLGKFCNGNKKVLYLFFDLAMEVEGFIEALEGASEEIFDEEIDLLAQKIANAMKEV